MEKKKKMRSTIERKINGRETSICGGTKRISMRGKRKGREKIKNSLLFVTSHTSPHWIRHDSNLHMTCWLDFLVAEEVAHAAQKE
jgi:hypothetical protein